MKTIFGVVLGLLSTLSFAQTQTDGNLDLSIKAGQPLRLDLSAGDYQIKAGDSDRVVITVHPKHPGDLKKVSYGLNTKGEQAVVKVNGPRNFSATIEVPPHVDLTVRLSAGDLSLAGVQGSKDIETHAGDLTVDVVDPQQYGNVDLSVTAGDIDASPFNASKSGLGRSFHQNGPGKYRLHVHCGAGDIRLTARQMA